MAKVSHKKNKKITKAANCVNKGREALKATRGVFSLATRILSQAKLSQNANKSHTYSILFTKGQQASHV